MQKKNLIQWGKYERLHGYIYSTLNTSYPLTQAQGELLLQPTPGRGDGPAPFAGIYDQGSLHLDGHSTAKAGPCLHAMGPPLALYLIGPTPLDCICSNTLCGIALSYPRLHEMDADALASNRTIYSVLKGVYIHKAHACTLTNSNFCRSYLQYLAAWDRAHMYISSSYRDGRHVDMFTCRRIPTLSTGKDTAGHHRSVGKGGAREQREVVEVGGLSTERFEARVMQSGGVGHVGEPSKPRGR